MAKLKLPLPPEGAFLKYGVWYLEYYDEFVKACVAEVLWRDHHLELNRKYADAIHAKKQTKKQSRELQRACLAQIAWEEYRRSLQKGV